MMDPVFIQGIFMIHNGIKELKIISAQAFGIEHGGIGILQQYRHIITIFWINANTYAA